MIKILVYGDSNVWGDNFITGKRIPDEKQWVNILQNKLGNNYKIIQEGLPGRIAGNEEKEKNYKNGKNTFISIFKSHSPIDVLIISLGTNDLQIKYNKTSNKIIEDLIWYKKQIEDMYNSNDKDKYLDNKMPQIIYILPFNFDYKENASIIFNYEKELERQKIIKYFNDNNIKYLSFNNIDLLKDGIHLSYIGHEKLANNVFEVIK